MQIEQKLELMHQQKPEYLAYQQRLQAERQTAIQQIQQQQTSIPETHADATVPVPHCRRFQPLFVLELYTCNCG